MSIFGMQPDYPNPPEIIRTHPWDMWMPPFRVAPHVYYASGNDWVSCFLIDTGDGLAIIDTSHHELLYMLTESVRILGFDPKDIKHILLSHEHADHCGGLRALKEYSGAEVYMSKEGYDNMRRNPDFTYMPMEHFKMDFEPDHFYSDDEPIKIGNFTIRTQLTPGHTPGVTSFFFEDIDEDGTVYRCAMHGGMGLNAMKNVRLDQFGLPHSCRKRYIADLEKLANVPVEICLPSHPRQTGIFEGLKYTKDNMDFRPFVDPQVWPDLMNTMRERAIKLDAQESAKE